MKPSSFRYRAPRVLDECVQMLAEDGDQAKLLAGGQSLVPLMNLRLAAPEVLIDLNGVADLDYIREAGDGGLVIGALTRHRTVETSALVRERCPLLAEATALVGYHAIRNRGTIGGSLAHADPVAELPCVARTLDATLVAAGPDGRREIAADEFFAGFLTTALQSDEVLVEIRFPASGPAAMRELSRKSGDFAIVAAAAELTVVDGAVQGARIGLAGAADRPIRASEAESALVGGPLDAERIEKAASRAPDGLAQVMVRRALTAAWGRA